MALSGEEMCVRDNREHLMTDLRDKTDLWPAAVLLRERFDKSTQCFLQTRETGDLDHELGLWLKKEQLYLLSRHDYVIGVYRLLHSTDYWNTQLLICLQQHTSVQMGYTTAHIWLAANRKFILI